MKWLSKCKSNKCDALLGTRVRAYHISAAAAASSVCDGFKCANRISSDGPYGCYWAFLLSIHSTKKGYRKDGLLLAFVLIAVMMLGRTRNWVCAWCHRPREVKPMVTKWLLLPKGLTLSLGLSLWCSTSNGDILPITVTQSARRLVPLTVALVFHSLRMHRS